MMPVLNPQKKEIRNKARKAIEESSKGKRFIGPLDRSEGAPSRWSHLYYASVSYAWKFRVWVFLNTEKLIDLANKTSEIKSI